MTVQLAVAFTTTLVEYQHLVTLNQCGVDCACSLNVLSVLRLANDLHLANVANIANYLCALYCGSTYCDCTVVVNQQYTVELYGCVILSTFDVVHEQFLAGLSLELLSINLNNCVHLI